MTSRKTPGPRRRAVRELTPVSSEWAALRFGYSTRRDFSDDLRELWDEQRDRLDVPKSWAAYWWTEHGLSRDPGLGSSSAHAAAKLYRQHPGLSDEEIVARATADPDWDDPRR